MSFKNEENASENRKLIFLLASVGYLDAQAAELSNQLDKDRYIHHSFAVLDSLSSSYSMFRFFFEVFISNNNDPDLMRQIMTSPQGIAAITAEALFLVTFSFLASYFDKKDVDKKDAGKKNPFKAYIVIAWPYFRDVMKGMKNAYKGWKSAAQIMGILGGVDLRFMFIPVGLALGVVASANRIWVRSMDDKRKSMMKENAETLKSIRDFPSFTKDAYDVYLKRIHYQSDEERIQAFFAKALGGFIDSLYLYAGLISLAILSPPVFLAMSIISFLYTITCIIARLYDEYDEQLKLQATQTKCRLALISRVLDNTYNALLVLKDKPAKSDADRLEINRLKTEVMGLIDRFEHCRQLLKNQTSYSYATAAFFGIRQGLFVYGVLASFLFMVTSVLFITAAVFPPVLLIAFIASGLVSILGVAAYTTITHYFHLQNQKKEENDSLNQLITMKDHINTGVNRDILSGHFFMYSLEKRANPPVSPPFYFQDWLEVFRSSFSGLSKGSNFAAFIATPFHEIDSQGNDSGASMMLILKMGGVALFSIILTLRALARAKDLRRFHDKGHGATCLKKTREIEVTEESHEQIINKPPASSSSASIVRRVSFFAPNQQSSSSRKLESLASATGTNDYKVLGLE